MNINGLLKVGGAFLGGMAVGGAIGYFSTRKYIANFFAEVAYEEIQEIKAYYTQDKSEDTAVTKEEFESEIIPDDMSYTRYVEILEHSGYSGDTEDIRKMFDDQVPIKDAIARMIESDPEEEVVAEEETTNIFTTSDHGTISDEEGPAFAESVRRRNKKRPYIIHVNEFMSMEEEPYNTYDKIPVVYYEGDKTLCDEHDVPIPDVDRLIGSEALENFGKFSDSEDVVYIRNEREDVQADFEVHRKYLSYEEHVLGIQNTPSSD